VFLIANAAILEAQNSIAVALWRLPAPSLGIASGFDARLLRS